MQAEKLAEDTLWMRKAIKLGENGRLSAPPNPWVGCIIVKDGTTVGQGYHLRPGEAHAEINALQQAGERARGSTAYVTLEPCSHHGRTPPCVDALIGAGLRRVVVGAEDPDPQVSGQGIARLRKAGIETIVVSLEDVRRSLAPYLHHRRTGRPYCLAKVAVSIDGRTAAQDGSSRWITDPEARVDAHRLRAESQAVMIGSGTARKDAPALNVRDFRAPGIRQPLRVVLDASGVVGGEGPLFDTQMAPTLIFTTDRAAQEVVERWRRAGAEVVVVSRGRDDQGVDLSEVLSDLGARGILQLMVEGGSRLHSSLLRENLVDHLVVYHGACLLGDKGLPLVQGVSLPNIAAARRFQLLSIAKFGNTIRADYVNSTQRHKEEEGSQKSESGIQNAVR